MKLDGKPVFFHGTIDHKYDSKLFGYKNIALKSIGLKSGNGIVNEDQYGALSDMNGKEGNADRLQYAVNDEDGQAASKLDCSIRVDDAKNNNEKEVRGFVAPMSLTHSSLKTESFEDTVFYVDKSVMESELPEFVVCYKENTYHVVKDICVDEGVPSQDRFLFDPGVSEENLCLILPPKGGNIEIAKEVVDLRMCIPDDLKHSAEKEKLAYLAVPDILVSSEEEIPENENSLEYDSKELIPIGEGEADSKNKIANVTSKGIFSLGELLSMTELGREHFQTESANDNIGETEQQPTLRSCESTIMGMASACEESENCNEPEFLVNPVLHIAEESDFVHQDAVSGTLSPDSAAKASGHGQDEMGRRAETNGITSNSCSSKPTATGGEEDPQYFGSENIENSLSRPEETNIEPFPSQIQYSLGETSFSAAVPLSGLISYSGLIANSGSVSLRSDSSTTSTRSFAFPVLQPEWNSSPVRMAKPDRRHHQKNWNWRQSFLCCRF